MGDSTDIEKLLGIGAGDIVDQYFAVTMLTMALIGTGFGIQVALHVSIPGMDKAQAKKIVDAAHQVCPYSNATRGNIDVALTANGHALEPADRSPAGD